MSFYQVPPVWKPRRHTGDISCVSGAWRAMSDASGRSRGPSSWSTAGYRQTAAVLHHRGSERTEDNSPRPAAGLQLPTSKIVAYRGVRGLKHDRIQRTAAVVDRPSGTAAAGDRRPPSSSDQPRPDRTTSSRRSVSADRQAASTTAPRTLFETLYQEKVCRHRCCAG